MQRELQPARRTVQRAQIRRELPPAVDLLLAGAAAVLVINTLTLPGSMLLVVLPCLIALSCAVFAAIRISSRRAGWEEAARRLDAVSNQHNLIETAWSLLHRGGSSSFAVAAIEQGMNILSQNQNRQPLLPGVIWNWGRKGGLVILVAMGIGLGWWMPAQNIAIDDAKIPQPHVPAGPFVSAASAPATAAAPVRECARSDRRPTPGSGAAVAPSESQSPVSSEMSRAQVSHSGAAGQSGSARQMGSHPAERENSGEAQSVATAPDRKETRAGLGRSGAAGSESHQAQESTGSASIVGTGSGTGQTLALANKASTRDPGNPEDAEGDEGDQKLEEQAKGNQQRGGLQPSLPDRTAAPSRELGITGPESGRPGTGRGGPSPAKKSRGVASLLMGVALPDFISGKTGPGPAAVAFDDIEPIPSTEPPGEAAAAQPRSLAESRIDRVPVRWADAPVVKRYLVGWHSLDHASLSARPRSTTGFPSSPDSKAGSP